MYQKPYYYSHHRSTLTTCLLYLQFLIRKVLTPKIPRSVISSGTWIDEELGSCSPIQELTQIFLTHYNECLFLTDHAHLPRFLVSKAILIQMLDLHIYILLIHFQRFPFISYIFDRHSHP